MRSLAVLKHEAKLIKLVMPFQVCDPKNKFENLGLPLVYANTHNFFLFKMRNFHWSWKVFQKLKCSFALFWSSSESANNQRACPLLRSSAVILHFLKRPLFLNLQQNSILRKKVGEKRMNFKNNLAINKMLRVFFSKFQRILNF